MLKGILQHLRCGAFARSGRWVLKNIFIKNGAYIFIDSILVDEIVLLKQPFLQIGRLLPAQFFQPVYFLLKACNGLRQYISLLSALLCKVTQVSTIGHAFFGQGLTIQFIFSCIQDQFLFISPGFT
ncbi:hypothetical protein D3C72_1511800 [compost metagenome]